MAWKIYDDTIDMVQRRFQYFPDVFFWRGRRHRVQSVRRCWTTTQHGWKRSAARHYFDVECAEGEFEVYQDVKDGTWHLRRARLLPARVAVVRQPVPASR
ncbi:MAG: DUF6504 family protein [Anaerolineae bacterium]|jgi:hypothetical protein